MKFPFFKTYRTIAQTFQEKKGPRWMIGMNIDTGSFVYMLVDSSDTVGIVRLFAIEVVRAERVENKIENR